MAEYVWLIPLFPLIGVIINGLIGIRFPKGLVGFIGSLTIFASFVVSCCIFWELIQLPADQRVFETVLWEWVPAGDLLVNLGFLVDPLSMVMMLVVSGVAFLIHVYSIGYMHDDPGFRRFFVYLNLFVFFMLMLVSGNSFLLMFVGWEGVGLCSYLLIGFWYEEEAPSEAGKKAFVVNRVGDYGFLLGMMLIFVFFGSLDFLKVLPAASDTLPYGGLAVTMITLLLFVGATGKSAQIPLYTWLPDAMEGPTPVSALIHAATMVTAGVYMVTRCSALFVLAPISMWTVAIIGAVTAFFAATIGLTQFDIKRVLAYSTISQLGYMFLACGVGAFSAGIFHLMTHAFFKACLFLGAGSVMHGLAGELDIRKMGALKKYMPWTFRTFLISTIAIAGIFPFAGFFSKDAILWGAFQKHTGLWLLGAITAFMTALYMFRAVFMTFYGQSRMDHHVEEHVHESPSVMTVPLVILAFLALVGGWIGWPTALGGSDHFHHFLSPVITQVETAGEHHAGVPAFNLVREAHAGEHAGHMGDITGHGEEYGEEHAAADHGSEHHDMSHLILEWGLMSASLILATLGILLAYFLYLVDPKTPVEIAATFKRLHRWLFNKYYIDELYDAVFVQPIRRGSEWLWHAFDEWFIDGIANGSARVVGGCSAVLKRIQTGYVQQYVVVMLVGIVLLIAYYLFW